MQVHCPHCRNTIDLAVDSTLREVVCPNCGSTIRLENKSTTAWNPTDSQRKLGKFELIDRVGMGAFGTVYKARDPELGRLVAIKVPRSGSLAGKEDLDRFLREARSVAQLRHPSIVPVYDVGQSDSVPYLVSEYVDGLTLADLLTARKRTPKEAAELVSAVADTLQYAHDQGVIHRDVKPSNILLDKEGKPHLMDFGLAKRDATEVTMTLDGQVLGTPAYMSPEQARGEGHRADGRSDIYSLGVIFYELLTGALPFQGSTRALLHQVQHDDPPPFGRDAKRSVPRDLETICLKCLRKEPEQRYATAGELADDLRCFLAGEPIKARRMRFWERMRRTGLRRKRDVALVLAGAAAVILVNVFFLVLVLYLIPLKPSARKELIDQAPATTSASPVVGRTVGVARALPIDSGHVPDDAFAFVSVNLSDLIDSPGVDRALKRIARDIPELKVTVEKWPEVAERELGVPPKDIRRIIGVMISPAEPTNPEMWVNNVLGIVLTAKAYDRAKLLDALGKGYEEKESQGLRYYLSTDPQPGALAPVSPKVFLVGSPLSLVAYSEHRLTRLSRAPLFEALGLVTDEHPIVVGVNLSTVLPFVKLPDSPHTHILQPLLETQSAVLLVRLQSTISPTPFGDTLHFELRLFFADQESAAKGMAVVKELLEQAQTLLPGFVSQTEREAKETAELLQKQGHKEFVPLIQWINQFSNRFEEALASAEVRQENRIVRLQLRLVADIAEWGVYWARLGLNADPNKFNLQTVILGVRRTKCENSLHQLAEAMKLYGAKFDRLPPRAKYGKDGKPLLSWRVLLLPYLGENELFKQFHLDEAWDSPHNKSLLDKMPKVFAVPGDEVASPTMTCYRVVAGKRTLFEDADGKDLHHLPKGGDQALIIVESAYPHVEWTKPDDLEIDPGRPLPKFGGIFPDGFYTVSGDGKVHFVRTVDEKTLRALCSCHDCQTVDWKTVERNKLP